MYILVVINIDHVVVVAVQSRTIYNSIIHQGFVALVSLLSRKFKDINKWLWYYEYLQV